LPCGGGENAEGDESVWVPAAGAERNEAARGKIRATLLCVRYRFDETRGVKLKTVEIIVDEKPVKRPRFKDGDMVPVAVAYHEKEIREQLRALRARWDAERKLWYVRYELIRGTPLAERVALVCMHEGESYRYA
jgi:hypothetical protein